MKASKRKRRDEHRERSYELLWGVGNRPRLATRPALSLERIVGAAVEIVDAEGLAALTLGRVAERLGVTPMAIYRYVPGKEQLVDLMIDAARGAPRAAGGVDWRTDLADWARGDFAVLQRHPWLLESIMSRAPIGPNWLSWVESALRTLAGTGLTPKEMLAVVVLVDGHVRSAAQISLGVTGTGAWAESFGRALEAISGDDRYPTLSTLVAKGGFEPRANDGPDPFEFGLERVLDGVDEFIRARGAARRQPKSARGKRRVQRRKAQ